MSVYTNKFCNKWNRFPEMRLLSGYGGPYSLDTSVLGNHSSSCTPLKQLMKSKMPTQQKYLPKVTSFVNLKLVCGITASSINMVS